MSNLLFLLAVVYLALCVTAISAFALSLAVTEFRWRLKCRKNRRMGYLRDWTLP